MCLVTWNIAPKIAEEDRICYKVLLYDGKSYESPYYEAKWEVGKKHHCGKKSSVRRVKGCNLIEGGYFHTFQRKEDAIAAAVHGTFPKDAVVFKSIIPKGSIMWPGFTSISRVDSYASKDLVIKENVYPYKTKIDEDSFS